MSHCIPINNGILCMCDADFNCPICGCLHTEKDYYNQLYKSKKTFIYKRCKGCKKWIGITTDIRGDVRVWERELKQPVRSCIECKHFHSSLGNYCTMKHKLRFITTHLPGLKDDPGYRRRCEDYIEKNSLGRAL